MSRSLTAAGGVALASVAAVVCVAAAAPGVPPSSATVGGPGAAAAPADDSSPATEPSLQTMRLPRWTGARAALPRMPSDVAAPDAGPDGPDAGPASRPVVYTGQLEAEPFELAAVTWHGAGAVTAWVRTRSDGSWTQWYELPSDGEHAPDTGTREAAGARNGTDPLIVARSDGVQVRVDTAEPASVSDLRLDLVTPGEQGVDDRAAQDAGQVADEGASAATLTARRPSIHSRAEWGADESLRADPPEYGQVRGAFVHHTVSATNYAQGDVPGMIRAIYHYHVRSRGWNDIGYNFLIDRFGRVWEGRHGGAGRAVIGAHTYGFNSQAFAMAALGTYTGTSPSVSMIRGYQKLFAWKFAVHGIDPRRSVSYGGESWPAVAGHRDAAATACPGDALYAQIGAIRRGTITEMGLAPGRDLDRNWRPDLVATRSDGTLWLAQGVAGGFQSLRQIGTGWQSMSAVVSAGNWDGDASDDLIARRSGDGSLWLYPGHGDGRFGAPRQIGWRWNTINMIVAASDWDGDGHADVIARRASDASLWLYPGRGDGSFSASRRIGTGWAAMDAILAPGDWTGDGIPDLVARRVDGTLWLYPGAGGGTMLSGRQGGHGWRGYRLVAAGDVSGDGFADLVGASPAGALVLLSGNGRAGFGPIKTIGRGWGGYNRLI